MTLREAALRYATVYGWPVFPVRPRGKMPLTENGVHDATTDPATIEGWWSQWPDANIGFATGKVSGVCVVDIDGPEGEQALAELMRQHGPLPLTAECQIGRGRHLYFKMPTEGDVRNSAGKVGRNIDVRGTGGYVILPPSIHESGVAYQWRRGPAQTKPAAAPDWLLALLAERREPPRQSDPLTADARLRAYAASALAGELAAMARATEGARNDQLNRSAFALGTLIGAGALDRTTAERALTSAAAAAGLPPPEVERTIKSGIQSGMQHPRELPEGEAGSGMSSERGSAPDEAWPAPLDPAALEGLAGEFLALVAPCSESDPAALLLQFLAGFGNVIGHGPHYAVEADRHTGNLFVCIVGETAKGRKGTGWGQARRVIAEAAPAWTAQIHSGLSSGEGVVEKVRDPVEKMVARREKGRPTTYEREVVDEGVADKRLLILEAEFSNTLKVATREGNTLSAVLRNAWDSGDLGLMTRNNPLRATGAHISIVAHVTRDELLRLLTETDAANGFGNRFLWACSRRSKVLPFGGRPDAGAMTELARQVGEAVEFAKAIGQVGMNAAARVLWTKVYPDLSEGAPGLLGAMTGRAEAQAVRLALLYALLDQSPAIGEKHLLAALAVWEYCEASCRFIFGTRLGDQTGDAIWQAVRRNPDGMTRTQLRDLFGRNKRPGEIDRALAMLAQRGMVVSTVRRDTGGRPAEHWTACLKPAA